MDTPIPLAPLLSLIIATQGRKRELYDLLESIPSRHFQELEVLIVDQNPDELLSDLATTFVGLQLQHIRVRFQNANAARNLGAKHATAEWLMFPDDDATFMSDTLSRALSLIRTDDFDLISGQIVNEANVPHLLRWLAHPAEITPGTIEHTLVESSFFIRRSIFLAAKGFDPLFGPGGRFPSAEGADLVYRLWQQCAVRSLFDPAIALYHPSKQMTQDVRARQRIQNFAMGEGAFTARHYRMLPLFTIGRKLLFRTAGLAICRGEKRLRKIAYLRGFFRGLLSYRGLDVSAGPQTFERSTVL